MTQMNHNEFKACVGRTTFEIVGCDHEFNTIVPKVGIHTQLLCFHKIKNILDHNDEIG